MDEEEANAFGRSDRHFSSRPDVNDILHEASRTIATVEPALIHASERIDEVIDDYA